MKISAINTNFQQAYKSTNTVINNNNSRPSFGFGIDYGDDDYLVANNYEYKEGSGSVFEYFRLLGELVCTLYKEHFCSGNFTCSDNSIFDSSKNPIVTYVTTVSDEDLQDSANVEVADVDSDEEISKPLTYLDFMDDDEWY